MYEDKIEEIITPFYYEINLWLKIKYFTIINKNILTIKKLKRIM